MFGISTTEFLIILAVGLIVLGPQKLPELARALGKAIGEFRKATTEIKQTFEADENIAQVKRTFDEAVAEGMKSGLNQETVDEALKSTLAEHLADASKSETEAGSPPPWDNNYGRAEEDKAGDGAAKPKEKDPFAEAADFTGEIQYADPKPEDEAKTETEDESVTGAADATASEPAETADEASGTRTGSDDDADDPRTKEKKKATAPGATDKDAPA